MTYNTKPKKKKDKTRNNYLQNTAQKTKDRAIWIPWTQMLRKSQQFLLNITDSWKLVVVSIYKLFKMFTSLPCTKYMTR
jgi:predicted phosphohydrolase